MRLSRALRLALVVAVLLGGLLITEAGQGSAWEGLALSEALDRLRAQEYPPQGDSDQNERDTLDSVLETEFLWAH